MTSFVVENIFGVGSYRLCAGFPSSIKEIEKNSNFSYESPINGCLQIYDFSNEKRIHFEHIYDDIIVVMIYNQFTNQILTCSYSGKIIIWSHNYEKRLVQQSTRIDHVHYGYWTRDGTNIFLCSRFDGTILSLNYDSQHHSLTENWLRHWARQKDDREIIHPSVSDDIGQKIETSNTFVAGSIGYEFIISTAIRRHVFAVLQRPQENVEIHQLNLHDGHLVKEIKLEPAKNTYTFLCGTTETIIDKSKHQELFAIGLQAGLIFLIRTEPLSIARIINATGTPQAMIWWSSNLLTIGYISSIINVFSLDGVLLGSCQGAPKTAVCHLHWHSDDQELLWIGGYMGLSLLRLELVEKRIEEPSNNVVFTILNSTSDEALNELSRVHATTVFEKCFHETAGCGIYLKENTIYSGDLSGHIFRWSIDQSQPKHHVAIPDSVRCFISEDIVGTLSGNIYNANTGEQIDDLGSTVICSAWNKEKTLCLIGLGDGRLIDFQTKKVIGLHENNAEIWSVCWSPDEQLCATASEDQTTCVWKVDREQDLVARLTGHTTAVTGIQWKKSRIYTCADDRTVRIYEQKSNDFVCINVLRTPKTLFGWFTLTYLKVDPDQHLIICTTQNGYLLIWRDEIVPKSDLPILCKKIHFGSLEGLEYDPVRHRVVVVSSDCSVTSLRLNVNEIDN